MDPPISSAASTATTTSSIPSKPSNLRALHSKRSFGTKHAMPPHHLHAQPLDSPAYDASEEDNDPLTDSGASAVSTHASSSANPLNNHNNRTRSTPQRSSAGAVARRHVLASSLVSSDDGVDSPTYDGDIESSTTAGPDTPYTSTRREHYASSASTLSPASPPAPELPSGSVIHSHVPKSTPSPPALHRPTPMHPSRPTEPSPASRSTVNNPLSFDPAKLTPEDIQAWFQEVRYHFHSSQYHSLIFAV